MVDPQEPELAWIQVGLILVSVALSYLTARLSAPKVEQQSPIKDTKPTTASSRGSWIPWVLGEARLAPVVCWVGNRSTETEGAGSSGGKGGGGTPSGGGTLIYYEEAVHVLCIGPGYKLGRIWSDGTLIFSGSIDQSSHPTGSTIDLEDGNEFVIRWGEEDGPMSSWLNTRLGVNSRWPKLMMVLWTNKRLGTAARWPSLEYEVQVRPSSYSLETTQPWIYGLFTATSNVFSIVSAVDGDAGQGIIRISGDHLDVIKPGVFISVAGNAIDDAEYEVFTGEYNSGTDRTQIYLVEPLEGSNNNGTVTVLKESDAGGVNYGHAIYSLLFRSYPEGLGLDLEDFDLTSLSEIGALCVTEGVACAVKALNGESARAILSGLLQDLGVVISLDPNTGLYRFVAIRAANSSDDIVPIPEGAILAPIPEYTTDLNERDSDRLQYSYDDKLRAYREGTIVLDADYHARFVGHKKQTAVRIPTAIYYSIVKKIAARRQQEAFASTVVIELVVNRGGQRLYPGRLISIPDYPVALRIMTKESVPLSAAIKLEVVEDFYGIDPSTLDETNDVDDEESDTGVILALSEPLPDAAATWIETPKALSPYMPSIVPLHIRLDKSTSMHAIWSSRDGSSYMALGRSIAHRPGGLLVNALTAAGPMVRNDVEIDAVGPDIALTQDLTGDDMGWLSGKQWAVITDSSGYEICFLQSITAVSGSVFRLNGLIRARYGTDLRAFAADTTVVYIVDSSQLFSLRHPSLVPGTNLHVKIQTFSPSAMSLSRLPAITRTFKGVAVVPLAPVNLRCQRRKGQPNSYISGDDIGIKWDYRPGSNLAGAGWTLAGRKSSPIPAGGFFTLTLLDSMGATVDTKRIEGDPSYTLDNAELSSLFSGEPAELQISVSHTDRGFTSPATTITVTKV